MLGRRTGLWLFTGLAGVVIVAAVLAPRVAQPLSYHKFADTRGWFGIANFGDVASNIPFAILGICGLVALRKNGSMAFLDPRERWPYLIIFAGFLLTAFGSSYYHLQPGNARLVWDRLPMTLVFMGLVSAMITERLSVSIGVRLLPLLLLVGAASVAQWYLSEIHGAGDLRFYAAVQVYALAMVLLSAFLPPRYTRNSDLAIAAGFYVLAKICETADRQIFGAGHLVSGHTLKHLAAAVGGWWILRMLEKRTAMPGLAMENKLNAQHILTS